MGLFVLLGVLVSLRNSIRPAGIVIHHSGTNEQLGTPMLLAKIHEKRGFKSFYWGRSYSIGYHYLIYANGTIVPTRPEHLVGAHARGYNSYIGICLIGNFNSKAEPVGGKGPQGPTPEQMHSLVELCNSIRKRYGFPLEKIRLHRDLDPKTECPGDLFPLQTLMSELE